jgi:hypothetical protein
MRRQAPSPGQDLEELLARLRAGGPSPEAAPPEPRLRRLRRGVRRFVVRTAVVAALALALLGGQAVLPALAGWWSLRVLLGLRRAVRLRRARPLPPPPPPDPARLARRQAVRRWLRRIALASGALALLLGAWLAHLYRSLPDVDQIRRAANNLELLVDKQGDTIQLRQAIVTLQVGLDEMPVYLRDALLTMEDRRYYAHPGIDYRGFARMVLHLLRGRADAGGSTITQQLAKNLFLSHDRTPLRKVKELLLALKLEAYFTRTSCWRCT